jgi:hypothetical protein
VRDAKQVVSRPDDVGGERGPASTAVTRPGELSKDEKQRLYRIARRSATETAAILDVLERRNAVPTSVLHPARDLIIRVT